MDLPEDMDLDLNLPAPIEAISMPKPVHIDFEQASIAWRRNKISNGKGLFTYIKRSPKLCSKLTYHGEICGKPNCKERHGSLSFIHNKIRNRNIRKRKFLFGKSRPCCKNYKNDLTSEKMKQIIIID